MEVNSSENIGEKLEIIRAMAECGVQIEEEVLDMNTPELQVVKNSLKDQNMKLGMQQILKALVNMMPNNLEDQLVSNLFDFRK